ncbi:MAG: hypothetical protein PWP39_529 [Pyrococcus sp.]|nr:hypothetical protein [Pyrococcus sp.]
MPMRFKWNFTPTLSRSKYSALLSAVLLVDTITEMRQKDFQMLL